jgi:hypothetical protein
MHSKVSDWLPSDIKATRPVLQIFKMAGHLQDSPRIGFGERYDGDETRTTKQGAK